MTCPGWPKDEHGCRQGPDMCIPERDGECPVFCPVSCLDNQQMFLGFCMGLTGQCPNGSCIPMHITGRQRPNAIGPIGQSCDVYQTVVCGDDYSNPCLLLELLPNVVGRIQ